MQAFYEVKSCGSEVNSIAMGGVVRNYYLAAEKVQWNYAPSGKDVINDVSLTDTDRWACRIIEFLSVTLYMETERYGIQNPNKYIVS